MPQTYSYSSAAGKLGISRKNLTYLVNAGLFEGKSSMSGSAGAIPRHSVDAAVETGLIERLPELYVLYACRTNTAKMQEQYSMEAIDLGKWLDYYASQRENILRTHTNAPDDYLTIEETAARLIVSGESRHFFAQLSVPGNSSYLDIVHIAAPGMNKLAAQRSLVTVKSLVNYLGDDYVHERLYNSRMAQEMLEKKGISASVNMLDDIARCSDGSCIGFKLRPHSAKSEWRFSMKDIHMMAKILE